MSDGPSVSSSAPNGADPARFASFELPVHISHRHLGKLEKAIVATVRPDPRQDPPFLIWITGAAGVGKNTLVDAVAHKFERKSYVEFLRGQVYPHTSEVLEPILAIARELIARLKRRAEGQGKNNKRWLEVWNHITTRHAPALDRVLPEVEWGVDLIPFPDLEPEPERRRLIDHLAGLIVRAAELAPHVLHIDGAEHLDAPSRELIATLARIVRARRQALRAGLPLRPPPRLAIVLTSHQAEAEGPPIAISERQILAIPVRGLGREELGRLLAEEYGEVPLSTREKIHHLTGGNLLDLQARIFRERARRRPGDAKPSVREILDGRGFEAECGTQLGSLERSDRHLLSALALIEKPVSEAILAQVAALDEEEFTASIERLFGSGWIVRRANAALALRHRRMLGPLSEALGGSERARLHRRIAEAISAAYDKRRHRRFQEVYFHFSRGPQDETAIEAGYRAAGEALRLCDFESAIRIYRDLLARLDERHGERLRLALTTLTALLAENRTIDERQLVSLEALLEERGGGLPEAVRAGLWRRLGELAGTWELPERELAFYQRALAALDEIEHSNERLLVYACIARTFLRRRQYDRSLDYCRTGLEESGFEALGNDPEFLEICRVTQEAHFHRGEMVEALAFEERYLRLARAEGKPEKIVESLLRLAYLAECQGQHKEACEFLQDALPIARSTGARMIEAKVDERLGHLFLLEEDWVRAAEAFQRALEVNSEVGDEARTVRLLGALGMVAMLVGDAEGGARNFRLYALYQGLRERRDEAPSPPGLPCDYVSRAERDEEIGAIGEIVHRAKSVKPRVLIESLSELGDLHRDCGAFELARATLRRGFRIAEEDGAGSARFALQLGIIFRMQGEYARALGCFHDGLQAMRLGTTNRDWIAECNVQVGIVSVDQGNYQRGLGYLTRGLRSYLEQDHELGVAHALITIAEVYRRLGCNAAAEELALAALAIADAAGTDRLEAEAWLLLGSVRARRGVANEGYQETGVAKEMFNRLGLLDGRCRALLNEVLILRNWGDPVRALATCGQALEIARDLGLRPLIARALVLRGEIEGERKHRGHDFLRALQTFERALEHIRASDVRELEVEARAAIARLYEERDRIGVVRTELSQVRELVAGVLANCPAAYRERYTESLPYLAILRRHEELPQPAAAPSLAPATG